MSVVSAADIQLIADSSYLNRVVQVVAFTILYYDYMLTFPLEVERYWRGYRSLTWASFFFFVNRYISVMCHIPIIYGFFGVMPQSRCRNLQVYHQFLAVLTQFTVSVLLMLRTYALHMRNRKVIYFLSTICVVGCAVSVWVILTVRSTPMSSLPSGVTMIVGCDLRISQIQGYYLAAAWSSKLVFDGAVFILTLWEALRWGRMWSHSLFSIILRDGTMHFGVLAICYLSNILMYLIVQPKHKGILTTMTNVLSATIVTRMMLNIRNPDLLELPHRWPSEHEL